MGAGAGDFQHLEVGLEPFSGKRMRHRTGEFQRGEFVDAAASLANQKGDEIVRPVAVRAGDKGVAARQAMHEPLLDQELERSLDVNVLEAATAPDRGRVCDVVSPQRPVRGVKRLQNAPPDRRETHAPSPARGLRPSQRIRRARNLVRRMGAGVAMIVMRVGRLPVHPSSLLAALRRQPATLISV